MQKLIQAVSYHKKFLAVLNTTVQVVIQGHIELAKGKGKKMNYSFDPPENVTIKDLADMFKLFAVEIDNDLYQGASENVKRLFKPSIKNLPANKTLN
jgi:hypothetical protein